MEHKPEFRKQAVPQKNPADLIYNLALRLSLAALIGGAAITSANHPNTTEAQIAPSPTINAPRFGEVIPIPIPTFGTTRVLPPLDPPTATPEPTRVPQNLNICEGREGFAHWYSREQCLGCNPDRIMANGQPLNDNALTAAYNRGPFGGILNVRNMENNRNVDVEVTDRGAFDEEPFLSQGVIIDLTIAAKDAIGAGDFTRVCLTRIR
jgi:hypothetical protein